MRFMGQCAPAGLLVESTGLLLPVAPCLFSALYLAVLSALGGRVVSSHRRRERLRALPKRAVARCSFFKCCLGFCSSSVLLYVHRNHMTYQGREPRTATSSFTHLLSSVALEF